MEEEVFYALRTRGFESAKNLITTCPNLLSCYWNLTDIALIKALQAFINFNQVSSHPSLVLIAYYNSLLSLSCSKVVNFLSRNGRLSKRRMCRKQHLTDRSLPLKLATCIPPGTFKYSAALYVEAALKVSHYVVYERVDGFTDFNLWRLSFLCGKI